MNCEEYTHLASLSQDAPIRWRTRVGMIKHQIICVYCRRFAAQLGKIRTLLKCASVEPAMPLAMRKTLQHRLHTLPND